MKAPLPIISLLLFVSVTASAQVKPPFNLRTKTTEEQIRKALDSTLEKYRTALSEPSTWKQMNTEATNLLWSYFRKGQLAGSNATQAYFIKTGAETMTATDIKNNRKILIAGVALQKPSEYILIRIEK